MADFGGLASVLQMQQQGLHGQPKQAKPQTRKRSLDPAGSGGVGVGGGNDDPNAKVNSKLLQLLKENQEDFRIISGTNTPNEQHQQDMVDNNGVIDFSQPYGYDEYGRPLYYQPPYPTTNMQAMNNDQHLKLYYQTHNHDLSESHYLGGGEHSGVMTNHAQDDANTAAATAGVDMMTQQEQQALLQANLNANMMRFMRNTNSNKVYQKIKDINSLPEKLLLHIFSFLNHHEIVKCALVCKFWRSLAQNPKLWRSLKLRSEYKDSIHIRNVDHFTYLIAHRFNTQLEYIELPIDLITAHVLHELANKCANLKYLTLDFSAAMQLQDFNDLNAFPCNLKSMTICLSEVIFLEGFMRRIYSFLSSLEILHLIGTLETSNDPDETYETINIGKIKAYTPNLRVINLYGITFIDDNHIESIASGCIHLECIALNFCSRFKGYSLKTLLSRCKKIKSLLLQNTGIENEAMAAVDWTQTNIEELDLTSTDLSEHALLSMLTDAPNLTYLSVAHCDAFTDHVFQTLIKNKKLTSLQALNVSHTVNLSMEDVFCFLRLYGAQLRGFMYTGNVKITEQFWINSIKFMRKIKIVVMGTPMGWFKKIATRIHVDQIIESFAANCPNLERLEIQWDPETIRFNDNSRKFIDHLRLRCGKLKSFVLSDGEYYEMVKSNFERAERHKIVRTTTSYQTSIASLLKYYPQLLFN